MFLLRLPFSLFNLTWQSAFLALGQIWANKVRSLLTTIGIVIGVASVTAVVAARTGLKTPPPPCQRSGGVLGRVEWRPRRQRSLSPLGSPPLGSLSPLGSH